MAIKRARDRAYYGRLNALVDQIFGAAEGKTVKELAKKADLSAWTVYRLMHRVTLYPQLRTILYLAKAVGLEITFSTNRASRVRRQRRAG